MDLPHLSRAAVVLPVRVDPTDRLGPTRGQARGPRWIRVAPWYYVPAETDRARRHRIDVVSTMSGPGERELFVQRLRGAYERAARVEGPRSWTVAPPAWWVDTSTVAARRALPPYQRETWPRHRRSI